MGNTAITDFSYVDNVALISQLAKHLEAAFACFETKAASLLSVSPGLRPRFRFWRLDKSCRTSKFTEGVEVFLYPSSKAAFFGQASARHITKKNCFSCFGDGFSVKGTEKT